MSLFLTPNQEWASEKIIDHLNSNDIHAINEALNKLDTILYKSWAKSLTLNELREVFQDVMLEKNIKE